MARTLEQIQEDIIATKNAVPTLAKLNSRSSTAIWRLWIFVFAVAVYTHELLFDFFKEEINDTLDKRIQGTSEWYAQKALEYQDGDDLVLINNGTQLGYNPVVLDNRIVTRAAYRDNDGALILKLAKGDVNNLEKLSATELQRVNKYFERIKFAGTPINLSSLDPDLLMPEMAVYHDGVLSNEDIFANVKAGIEAYMLSLPVDGIFYLQRFVDAIQAIDHVVDVDIEAVNIKSFADILNPVTTLVDRKVILESGYLKLSTEVGETLDDLMTVDVES